MPASIASEPSNNAMVLVYPPLSSNTSRFASLSVPMILPLTPFVKPQVLSSIRLYFEPTSTLPSQLPPVLLSNITFISVEEE